MYFLHTYNIKNQEKEEDYHYPLLFFLSIYILNENSKLIICRENPLTYLICKRLFFKNPFDHILYKSCTSKKYIHPKNHLSATCVFQARGFTLGELGACRFASTIS